MSDLPTDASEVYGGYIQDEFDRQLARKASVEQRALSVITTSGVLVTLLSGLAALSGAHQTLVLPSASKLLLLCSLGLFVVAIVSSLAINVPRVYTHVTPGGLLDAVNNRWGDTPTEARKTVAETQITAIAAASKLNTGKGKLLFGAIASELCAVVLVAAAIGVSLYNQNSSQGSDGKTNTGSLLLPTDCAVYFTELDKLADDEPNIGQWLAMSHDPTAKACRVGKPATLKGLVTYLGKR